MYEKGVGENGSFEIKTENMVNVSGAFNNCFFHNYALYLLANHLSFPHDLFSFTSILADESKAKKLHHFFQDEQSLDSLSLLDSSHYFPHYLVEKTLILGVLLREWFASQLATNQEHKQDMLDGKLQICDIFKNYKEFRQFSSLKTLYETEYGLIYVSNALFLDYYFNRSESLDRNSNFEHYFTEEASEEDAIRAYWLEEGHALYCMKIAQLDVGISSVDMMTMLKMINQPFKLSSLSTGEVLAEYAPIDRTCPDFAIVFDVKKNHYLLLKTQETRAELEEYEQSYSLYEDERDLIKKGFENSTTSMFVRAICSRCELDQDPFDALMLRLQDLRPQTIDNMIASKDKTLSNYTLLQPLNITSIGCFSLETKKHLANTNLVKQSKRIDRYRLSDKIATLLNTEKPVLYRFFVSADIMDNLANASSADPLKIRTLN